MFFYGKKISFFFITTVITFTANYQKLLMYSRKGNLNKLNMQKNIKQKKQIKFVLAKIKLATNLPLTKKSYVTFFLDNGFADE